MNKTLLFTFFRFSEKNFLNSKEFKKENDILFKYEKDRYFEFLENDILQLKDAKVIKRKSTSSERLFLTEKDSIELKNLTISLVVFPKQANGTFIFEYDWKTKGNDPLKALCECTELRYLGTQSKFCQNKKNLLKTSNSENIQRSWLDLIKSEFSELGLMHEQIEYYSNKLGRIHLIGSEAKYQNTSEFLIASYNSVRIVNKILGTVNSDSLNMDVYQDPRIKVFAMNEGMVIQEEGKSPQQLLSKFAPILYQGLFLKLGFTDVSYNLLSEQSDIQINPRIGINEKEKIKKLRELRKLFLLLKFSSKIPISNYNEIERLRSYMIKRFSSEIDFEEFNDSLEDLFEFLQDERDREDSERGEKVNWILGVMGVTGFVSFIFDYIFVNGEIRLIDYLSGPSTFFPLISFIGILVLLIKLNK